MIVLGDNVIRLGSDGAVAKFIVIRVGGNHFETELRPGVPDVSVQLREQIQQGRDFPPAFRAGEPRGDFLVFEQNLGGNGEGDAAIQQRAENRIKRLAAAKDLQQDAGVQTDGHA